MQPHCHIVASHNIAVTLWKLRKLRAFIAEVKDKVDSHLTDDERLFKQNLENAMKEARQACPPLSLQQLRTLDQD